MTETAIGWTDQVWNPVTGCSKVSEGCRNCYAETISLRYGRSTKPWAAQYAAENVVLHPDRLSAPLKWKKPARCFVNSMSDLFHAQVPDEYIDRVFAVMANTPQHTYQILTKRPKRMARYINALTGAVTLYIDRTGDLPIVHERERQRVNAGGRCWPLPNVWLGTSVENQAAADERIPHLLRVPAVVRFISAEPLLGPVNVCGWDEDEGALRGPGVIVSGGMTPSTPDFPPEGYDDFYAGLDWIIVGGESGPRHRPMEIGWLTSIVDQCRAAGIATFVKQDSGLYPGRQGRIPDAYWKHEWPASPAAPTPEAVPL